MAKTFNELSESILGYPEAHHSVLAVDKDYGIAIKYVGPQASGTVTVDATDSDITFQHGVAGSEVVDGTIDSGGDDAGVIDHSDANANTMGEVVDIINASPNWKAMLIGCKRADVSVDALETLAETQAKINADHSVQVNFWGGIAVERTTATAYKTSTTAMAIGLLLSGKDLDGNDNSGRENVLASVTFSWTNGATTEVNSCFVYEVSDDTGAERLIYSKVLGDDPSAVVIDDDDFGDLLVAVEPGNGILVRADSDGDTTNATLTACAMQMVGGFRKRGVGGKKWFKSDM